MSPITHFLASWVVASTAKLNRKERFLVTGAGVVPDIDGLGLVADILSGNGKDNLVFWSEYHHILAHNVGFALLVGLTVFFLSGRKAVAAFLSLISLHLHFFCDIVGSRGPDGYQWPVPYLLPFSDSWQIVWEGQWVFNSWQNTALTGGLLFLTLFFAWKRGYSPLEMASKKVDKALVAALRARFGQPEG